MKELSIIVPVYNGGKFIDGCIKNLEKTKLIDFEIVIVNDGSTDDTDNKIKSIINKYKNIIYIKNKKNRGVSNCRNIGINASNGNYITFIDVDDTISPYAYSNMVKLAKLKGADVVVCNYIELEQETKLKNNSKYKYSFNELNKEETIEKYLTDKISPSSCDKVYKKKLLEKLKFNSNLQIGEDLLFCLNVFLKSNKNCFINEYYYTYFRQSSSVMHHVSKYLLQFKDVINYISPRDIKYFESNYKEEFNFFKLQMITRGIHSMSNLSSKKNKEKIINLLKNYYTKEDLNNIINCKYFPGNIKLEMFILKIFGIRFHLFLTPFYKYIKSKVR